MTLPLASRAADLAPGRGDVIDTLGWVHYRRGAYAEAAKVLARAAELVPKNAVIHYHLGLELLLVRRVSKKSTTGRLTVQLGLC